MKSLILSLLLSIFIMACSNPTSNTDEVPEVNFQAGEAPDESFDYTSKVPQFTFASTLEEQEEQLKTNPLILRFKESRKKLAKDPHVPLYHFISPENRLNDPNGLSFWQGRWHMFYQGYPPEDPRQHWGHAVSDDLIHWRDLPYAIYPNPEEKCYSGSALVEDDRVIAMYHGTKLGNMVATSSDPLLLNWEKVGDGAPISMYPGEDGKPLPYRIFDPCIWKKDGTYYALSGGQLPNGPDGKFIRANWLFRSNDLANWTYLHPFIENDQYSQVGDDGACPYFWPIGDKHIFLQFSHMSGGKYLLGDYAKDRDKFVVTNGGDFNFGPYRPSGVHAPSAAPEPPSHGGAPNAEAREGAVITIFNMNPGMPTEGWNQIMTLPRRLFLLPEGSLDNLGQEPAGDLASLRYDHKNIGPMTLAANKEMVLEGINGKAMEIIAEIDPKDSPIIELDVFRSPNREEVTRILFYQGSGYRHREFARGTQSFRKFNSLISIESSQSSILPNIQSRAAETANIFIDEDETLKLRVFIDQSVVEVFVNGRQCVAQRVYPGLDNSDGVSLRAQGTDAELVSLDAWKMNSIY